MFAGLSGHSQDDSVTPVDPVGCAVRSQPFQSFIDRTLQAVIGPNHANGNIPVEVRLALVEFEDAYRSIRMRQIEIARRGRGDRCRTYRMIGKSFKAVDLETKGRRGHVALIEGRGGHRFDQAANFRGIPPAAAALCSLRGGPRIWPQV